MTYTSQVLVHQVRSLLPLHPLAFDTRPSYVQSSCYWLFSVHSLDLSIVSHWQSECLRHVLPRST